MTKIETSMGKQALQKAFIAAASPHIFGLAVSLTEQCNFRCTYCYEKFELQAMSDPLYHGLKVLVETRIPALKHFNLSWFGGEPLLDWQRMVDFSAYCRSLCAQYGVHMPACTVPTNAWGLSTEVLQAMCEAGVAEIMVSLDGLEEQHNQTRRLISGRGTFERVYANLRKAAITPYDFNIVLRMHLHADNIESQIALTQQLARDFGNDPRFTLHPITIGDFGGDTVKSMSLLRVGSHEGIENQLLELFRPGALTKTNAMEPELAVCYAAKPNHIFIRPNGMISKCTSALDREDNNIGRLLPTGEIEVDDAKALAWSFGFKTGQAQDLSCPYWTKPQEQVITFMPRPS